METTKTTPPPAPTPPAAEEIRGIVYTDTAIEIEAMHLPEELRDAYRWLKSFTRIDCNRDIDQLTERFRKVGIYHDKGTWSKILKGRLLIDARGDRRDSPVLSLENFRHAVEALRSNVRAEALRGKIPFVETSVWHDIENYITTRMGRDRVNKFAFIIGPTGAQKSACFREIQRRINHGTIRVIECPETGALGEFLSLLAVSFGASPQTSSDKKRRKIEESVKDHHVIICDNAQELWREDRQEQPAFSFLRRLQDSSGCTIVLSITPTFERKLMQGMIEGYFEQFEGRSGGRNTWLRLPAHPPKADVLLIAQAFGLEDAEKHLAELVAISRQPGRVRRLFEVLQEGKRLAGAKKEAFTIDWFNEARGEA